MKKIVLSLLALMLIVEEWLWDSLSAMGHYLVLALRLARLERWLAQTSPAMALLVMAVPLLIVTPINIAALLLLTHGLIVQGLLLEVVAKLLGTLLIARVFALTKPQLLTFTAIAWTYATITGWLRWAHEKVAQTAVYQAAKHFKADVKVALRNWKQRLWPYN